MKIRNRSTWILSVALLATGTARAQSPADAPPAHGGMRGPGFGPGPFGERAELLGLGGMHGGRVVTGAPFSAVANGETTQKLADGTTIIHKSQSNLYRDSQGRVRREVTMPAIGPLAASGTPRSFVMIHDPVAQTGFILEPDQKVARKLPQREHGLKGSADPDAESKRLSNDSNVKKESLGTQTISGVSVEGTRYTKTIPAGQIGNDRALTVVKEEWYSPDLQMVIQSKRSDPFLGDATYTISNIQRTAPNANLFSVPSDYTVKDAPVGGKRRGYRGSGPPPADAPGPGLD